MMGGPSEHCHLSLDEDEGYNSLGRLWNVRSFVDIAEDSFHMAKRRDNNFVGTQHLGISHSEREDLIR